ARHHRAAAKLHCFDPFQIILRRKGIRHKTLIGDDGKFFVDDMKMAIKVLLLQGTLPQIRACLSLIERFAEFKRNLPHSDSRMASASMVISTRSPTTTPPLHKAASQLTPNTLIFIV